MTLAAAAVQASNWNMLVDQLLEISALVQPIVILSLLVLALATGWLHRLDYPAAVAMVIAHRAGHSIGGSVVRRPRCSTAPLPTWLRAMLFTMAATAVLLGYFDLRSRALSPALTEARLQALQARIRPHFLFNSINAVLSLIRRNRAAPRPRSRTWPTSSAC